MRLLVLSLLAINGSAVLAVSESEPCEHMHAKVIQCINQGLFDDGLDELRYETELDKDFRQHAEFCFRLGRSENDNPCKLANSAQDEMMNMDDGILSECQECLGFLHKIVKQLTRTSNAQRHCLHDEFQRWIDEFDGKCSDNANKQLGDFSNHHYAALTVRHKNYLYRIVTFTHLAQCMKQNPAVAMETQACLWNRQQTLYRQHCDEVIRKCIYQHLNIESPKCLKTHLQKNYEECACHMEAEKTSLVKLLPVSDSIFNISSREECIRAVTNISQTLVPKVQHILNKCLGKQQPIKIDFLINMACGKMNIFNRGSKKKLDSILKFMVGFVRAYQARNARHCHTDCKFLKDHRRRYAV